jgi:tetratricopeptide (TPR) repeat protein
MRLGFVAIVLCGLGLFAVAPAEGQTGNNDSDLLAMRKARDSAAVPTLRKAIDAAHQQAQQKNTASAYEQLALLNSWLCEAGHGQNDDKVIKQAAEDGVEAAKKATELDPKSSEAHRLEGDLLGQLIPHVFAGGMRYGRESTSELEKAIELNPNNVDAYIARAVSYFYTPSAFGGSHEKAVEMLKKAVSLDSASDTAHIWLARVYLEDNKRNDARGEINEALRLNPQRGFAQSVNKQLTAKEKQEKDQ